MTWTFSALCLFKREEIKLGYSYKNTKIAKSSAEEMGNAWDLFSCYLRESTALHKKWLHAYFFVGIFLSEQRIATAQDMKAGVWMRDCEGLLHPDMENVSWVTQGTKEQFQSMVLILLSWIINVFLCK